MQNLSNRLSLTFEAFTQMYIKPPNTIKWATLNNIWQRLHQSPKYKCTAKNKG